MKKLSVMILLIAICGNLSAEKTMFEQGKDLLLENRLSDAAVMFEGAVEIQPDNTEAYLYLGYIYEVKQDYSAAVSALSRGLGAVGAPKEKLYFNIGNNQYKAGDFASAAESFSKAIRSSAGFADAYLNRANCRVQTGEYSLAVRDYRLFLSMKPDDGQKPNIEKMISALEQTIVQDEIRRKEEEQRKIAEEARQKALLDSVLNSLSNAGSDTTNLSAESENIEDVELDLDIED